MRQLYTEHGRKWRAALVALAIVLAAAPAVGESPSALTVEVTNRMYLDYREVFETKMHEREQLGDTDYFFEVIEFFPHFAIIDSTKEVVSLSDELKNPAFKIKVYKEDELVEDTWAFYAIDIPHYSPQSFLAFRVLEFEYRGEVQRKESKKQDSKREDV